MNLKKYLRKEIILFVFLIYSSCASNMYIKLELNKNTIGEFMEDDIKFSMSPTYMRLVSPYSPESHLGAVFTVHYYTDVPVEIILESYEIYFDGVNCTIGKDNINDYFSFRESVIDGIKYTNKQFWGINNIAISIDDLKNMFSSELTGKELYKKFDKINNIMFTVCIKYKTNTIQRTKRMTWFYILKKSKSNAFIDMLMSV
jgi:hypothetical protein